MNQEQPEKKEEHPLKKGIEYIIQKAKKPILYVAKKAKKPAKYIAEKLAGPAGIAMGVGAAAAAKGGALEMIIESVKFPAQIIGHAIADQGLVELLGNAALSVGVNLIAHPYAVVIPIAAGYIGGKVVKHYLRKKRLEKKYGKGNIPKSGQKRKGHKPKMDLKARIKDGLKYVRNKAIPPVAFVAGLGAASAAHNGVLEQLYAGVKYPVELVGSIIKDQGYIAEIGENIINIGYSVAKNPVGVIVPLVGLYAIGKGVSYLLERRREKQKYQGVSA